MAALLAGWPGSSTIPLTIFIVFIQCISTVCTLIYLQVGLGRGQRPCTYESTHDTCTMELSLRPYNTRNRQSHASGLV